MFNIDLNTGAITMHRGDTGAYYANCSRRSGRPFQAGDVALYTVKTGDTVMMEREYPLDDNEGLGNGRYLVSFRNSDTDTWAAGTYNTEVRVAINPVRRDGKVVDGDNIRTIRRSKTTITIEDVLREV